MQRNVVVIALLLGIVACDREIPTEPTTPPPTSATQIIGGQVQPGDSRSDTLTIPSGQQVRITLTSLNDAAGVPMGGTVTLKLGVPVSGSSECSGLQMVPASARLTSHIKAIVSAGQYCLEVSDTAGLPAIASYTIRIVFGQPGGPNPAETLVFESTVVPGGSAARSFSADADGGSMLVMDTITPGSAAPLGMGIGHVGLTGSGCELSSYVVANPGTTHVVIVDAGTYCAKAFDLGTLTAPANFAMRIRRP